MSTTIPPVDPVPLMSAVKARDIGRSFKGWSEYLDAQGLRLEARTAERQSQWWLAYSITLSADDRAADPDTGAL
jgi:hypothetical protein